MEPPCIEFRPKHQITLMAVPELTFCTLLYGSGTSFVLHVIEEVLYALLCTMDLTIQSKITCNQH